MNNSTLQRFAPIVAVIGLVGFLVAGGAWIVTQAFDVYVQAALAVGVLGLAVAGLMNPGAIQKFILSRQGRYGGNALIMVAAAIGIVVLVNYLVARNPYSWDLSEDKQGSLAPETLAALQQLPQPVQALYFHTTNNFAESTVDTLERYRLASNGKFTYEAHNLEAELGLVEKYQVKQLGVLLLMGDQQQFVNLASETEITAGLLRLLKPGQTTIYFLVGQGELSLEYAAASNGADSIADLADTLTKQNYLLAPLDLQISATVPADAKAVVIAGPTYPVPADQVQKLQAYADAGGSLVILLDPKLPDGRVQTAISDTEPLVDYLRTVWGITLNTDLVIDPLNSYATQNESNPYYPLNGAYGNHQITGRMQNISTLFFVARSISLASDPAAYPGITQSPLINIADSGWGETNWESVLADTTARDAGDTPAPAYLAVAAENTVTRARVVVFGDANFVVDRTPLESPWPPNGNLLINSINWATQDEALLNLTPKLPTQRTLKPINLITGGFVVLVVGFIIPLSILVLGGITWYMRRKHV